MFLHHKNNQFFCILMIIGIQSGILHYQFLQETCNNMLEEVINEDWAIRCPSSNNVGDFSDFVINNWAKCVIAERIIEDTSK